MTLYSVRKGLPCARDHSHRSRTTTTLAVAFGPLLLLLAFGRAVSQSRAILMMIGGIAVALLWRHLGLHNAVYEGLPGIVAGLLIGLAPSKRAKPVISMK